MASVQLEFQRSMDSAEIVMQSVLRATNADDANIEAMGTMSNGEFKFNDMCIPITDIYGLERESPTGFSFSTSIDTYKFTTESKEITDKWMAAFAPAPPRKQSSSDFTIIDQIGKGSSGDVFVARHNMTGRLLALKVIPKESSQTRGCRAITERNLLLQASDPFVARLYSTFQTNESLVLVLEFVSGGDLGFHLDHRKLFSTRQIQLYLAELAVAVSKVHERGIVFRDLKPANILIDEDGHLKLTDFGLASRCECAVSMCGTHEYLAPEVIESKPYTSAVDWWSYGVVAYRLLVGVLPFQNQNLQKLYKQIVETPLKFWKLLPATTKDFISKLLMKDPNDRLGCGAQGESEIFEHPYFSGINWQKIKERSERMEFVPDKQDYVENFELSSSSNDDLVHLFGDDNKDETYVDGFSFGGQIVDDELMRRTPPMLLLNA